MANVTAKPVLLAFAIAVAGIGAAVTGGLAIANATSGWQSTSYATVDGQTGNHPPATATLPAAGPTPSTNLSPSPSATTTEPPAPPTPLTGQAADQPDTTTASAPEPPLSPEPSESPSESPTASPSPTEGVQP